MFHHIHLACLVAPVVRRTDPLAFRPVAYPCLAVGTRPDIEEALVAEGMEHIPVVDIRLIAAVDHRSNPVVVEEVADTFPEGASVAEPSAAAEGASGNTAVVVVEK